MPTSLSWEATFWEGQSDTGPKRSCAFLLGKPKRKGNEWRLSTQVAGYVLVCMEYLWGVRKHLLKSKKQAASAHYETSKFPSSMFLHWVLFVPTGHKRASWLTSGVLTETALTVPDTARGEFPPTKRWQDNEYLAYLRTDKTKTKGKTRQKKYRYIFHV